MLSLVFSGSCAVVIDMSGNGGRWKCQRLEVESDVGHVNLCNVCPKLSSPLIKVGVVFVGWGQDMPVHTCVW